MIFSERPEVKAVSAHVQVKAGEAAEIGCEVTRGSPGPEIVWSRQVRSASYDKTNTARSKKLDKKFDGTLYPPPVTG